MSEHESESFAMAEIGEPVSAEKAVAANDQVFAIRFDEAEQGVGLGRRLAMQEHIYLAIEHADIERTGMEIDIDLVPARVVVESRRSLLSEGVLVHPPAHRLG